MKQKSSLDIAKFVCAILVLIIHTNPFGSYSKILSFGFRNIVCVFAVPFFFATSGYLLMDKLSSLSSQRAQKEYMIKYLKRLLQIYLIWSAVYLPFVILSWVRTGFTPNLLLEYIKDFIFEGSYLTIWFLPALMAAAGAFFVLWQKLGVRKVFYVGCGFYIITLLLSSYYGITAQVPILAHLGQWYYDFFDSVKNGLLFGLIFVSLGAMLRQDVCFERVTRKQALLGFVLSGLLLCVEVVVYELIESRTGISPRGVDTVLSLVPATIFAMLFVLSFNVPPSGLCLTLRKYSMLIFLCQRLPISLIDTFLSGTVIATNTVVNCITVSAATFGISCAILKLSQKWQWLKKCY